MAFSAGQKENGRTTGTDSYHKGKETDGIHLYHYKQREPLSKENQVFTGTENSRPVDGNCGKFVLRKRHWNL